MPLSTNSTTPALDDFERLIEVPNAELYAWVTGDEAAPAEHDTAVLRDLIGFHAKASEKAGEGANDRTGASASLTKSPAQRLVPGRPLTLSGIADGAEGLVLADLARAIAAADKPPAISLAVVCRDGSRMATLPRALDFFAPDIEVLEFPAWDCLPYDRVSPHAAVVAQRDDDARAACPRQRPRPSGGAAHHRERHSAARAGARADRQAIALRRARQYSADGRHHPMARAQRF